jgi:Tol biopolymer transport system component
MGRLLPCLLLLALATAAPAHAATSSGYRTVCGVELASGVATMPGGPVCGTDEGDDVGYGGEDAAISFFGENGHDTVQGTRYGDSVNGGGGNDEVHGGRGNDRLDGGDDSDVLFGGLGDDVLLERRFGVRERLYGGPGNDVVAGGRGNDFVYGGTGNDVVLGGNGPDRLFGGPGDDQLYGGSGRDVFDCGPGNDTVYRVRGSAGRDGFIPRSAGCERIVNSDPTRDFPLRGVRGTDGADSLVGSGAAELLEGKGGADRMFGGGGDDELEGDGASLQGADLLMGGSGNDRLAGRSGDDRVYGDARSATAGPPGADELVGGSGRDLLVGGPGNDLLLARYDGDRVLAGAGNDVINLLGGDVGDENARVFVDCGPGRDVVVINPARRGTFRRCESFADQFYTADFGFMLRPSPEVYPEGLGVAARTSRALAAARRRPGRDAQEPPPPAPAEPAGGASNPSISADGNRVAFSADARNLAEGDVNLERTDAFVRDLPSAVTLLADATPRGTSAERGGRFGRTPGRALSGDGRYAVFSSNSSDVAGRVSHYTIFRRDLARRSTQVACRRGNDDSENPAISAGGHHVAFESRATNLAGRDANAQTDVYWCDMFTGEVRRVSDPIADSVNGAGTSLDPSISADGRYVAFTSDAGGLVPGDGQRAGVYWRDVQTGETRLVDVPAGALTSNGSGMNPRISPDGRYVVFDSDATDLPGGELNGATVDVFRKDVIDGTVTLVSHGADGSGANGDSTADSISGDGQAVGFSSNASNLVPGDGNGRADAFVRSLPLAVNSRVSTRQDATELGGSSSGVALSFDGRFAAFGAREPRTRIYRKDVATGALDHVSVGLDLPPRSLIGEPFGSELRRKVRLVAGTARDDGPLAAVDVAVSRRAGERGCVWLGRRGALVRRPCDEPLWLRARLTSGLRFTLRIGRLLPRGTWTVRSRATDAGGRVEETRPGANVVGFVLR